MLFHQSDIPPPQKKTQQRNKHNNNSNTANHILWVLSSNHPVTLICSRCNAKWNPVTRLTEHSAIFCFIFSWYNQRMILLDGDNGLLWLKWCRVSTMRRLLIPRALPEEKWSPWQPALASKESYIQIKLKWYSCTEILVTFEWSSWPVRLAKTIKSTEICNSYMGASFRRLRSARWLISIQLN